MVFKNQKFTEKSKYLFSVSSFLKDQDPEKTNFLGPKFTKKGSNNDFYVFRTYLENEKFIILAFFQMSYNKKPFKIKTPKTIFIFPNGVPLNTHKIRMYMICIHYI